VFCYIYLEKYYIIANKPTATEARERNFKWRFGILTILRNFGCIPDILVDVKIEK
jgi:hypothetical protein